MQNVLLTQFSCYCRCLWHLWSRQQFCLPSCERSSPHHKSLRSLRRMLRQSDTAPAPTHRNTQSSCKKSLYCTGDMTTARKKDIYTDCRKCLQNTVDPKDIQVVSFRHFDQQQKMPNRMCWDGGMAQKVDDWWPYADMSENDTRNWRPVVYQVELMRSLMMQNSQL